MLYSVLYYKRCTCLYVLICVCSASSGAKSAKAPKAAKVVPPSPPTTA